MSAKVLWLDNEPGDIKSFVKELRGHGYNVTVERSVSEAEKLLESNRYDLLIVDVMIPTVSENEEDLYPPEDTNLGRSTGLLFYKRVRKHLQQAGTSVLIMTVRLDKKIQQGFIEVGIPPDCFTTKLALRRVPDFLDKIQEILARYGKISY
jgi:CheY-like chemotaxis protein